ncbi:MAG: ATP-binding cassette domain-containing protein, partial [Anaerolineae bacterium]
GAGWRLIGDGLAVYNPHMSIIDVRGLSKTFSVKRKEAGLRGSLKSIIRPEFRRVEAVRGITFSLEPGELLAFIGPNGAGKSTTIKMLTGILYPSSGQAQVLGLTPWRDRRQLAYRIGSVFGQKPQLWYHLPPIDTFNLFSRIYELDDRDFKQRAESLIESFAIGDLIHTPVRKLSLGQRMRCEIAASLLHRPQVIFLDEPTIGLDVVAKQHIRDTIKTLHEQEGVTIFLTSHDAGDIESLCKRVIIVNHGTILYDDRLSALKRRYLTRKEIDVRFMMLTVLPAAFVGALPLNVVRSLDLSGLVMLAMAAAVITLVSSSVFYIGLRRYESGSAINVNA